MKWINALWNYLDKAPIPDALAWVWITWSFELTSYFDKATEYLMKNCTRTLEGDNGLEFPIPSRILRKCIDTDWRSRVCH